MRSEAQERKAAGRGMVLCCKVDSKALALQMMLEPFEPFSMSTGLTNAGVHFCGLGQLFGERWLCLKYTSFAELTPPVPYTPAKMDLA